MKDEEMAEEYADRTRIVDENTRAGTDCISLVQDYEGNYIYIHERIKQAFLTGLKAGRPQWHDLRKDPNDLPEDTYDVLDQAGYKVHYNFFQNVWVNEKDEIDEHVIAWCEIPTFDKEYIR